MARIHRYVMLSQRESSADISDGQKKPVFIYRLLTTNTIDEKIYQVGWRDVRLTLTSFSARSPRWASLTRCWARAATVARQPRTVRVEGSAGRLHPAFSFEELRDIFTVNAQTDGCGTREILAVHS